MKVDKTDAVYVKRRGKYVPIGVVFNTVSWPEGDYLVRIRKHRTSMRLIKRVLSIDAARVELAMAEMGDAICAALGEVDRVEHKPKKNTKLEQKAFAAYKKICGEDCLQMNRKSRQEVAEMAMRMVKEMMGKKTPCPEGCMDVFAEKILGPSV